LPVSNRTVKPDRLRLEESPPEQNSCQCGEDNGRDQEGTCQSYQVPRMGRNLAIGLHVENGGGHCGVERTLDSRRVFSQLLHEDGLRSVHGGRPELGVLLLARGGILSQRRTDDRRST